MSGSLGPSSVTLRFVQGETWTATLNCLDKQLNVVDLTGLISARWRMASNEKVLVDAYIGFGLYVKNAAAGQLRLIIPEAMQTLAEQGKHRHQLDIILASGTPATQMLGSVEVIESLFKKFPTNEGIAVAVNLSTAAAIGATA